MIPSPELIRAAIVAACVETGERPQDCSSHVMGIRARHYAMHALTHVCGRSLKGSVAAESVGCPGEGRHFYRNSMNQTVAMIAGRRRAKWWNEAAYDRTIRAVEAAAARPVVEAPPATKASRPVPVTLATVEALQVIAAAAAQAKARPEPARPQRPNFATTSFRRSSSNDDRDAYTPTHGNGQRLQSKAKLYEDLQRAVLNTPGSSPVERDRR